MKVTYLYFFIISIFISTSTEISYAQWSIDVEGGLASSGYNNVRIPGNTGTKLSLSRELQADNTEFYRVRLSYKLGNKKQISVLYAPFEFNSSGQVDRIINFNGSQFEAGRQLSSLYRFDSYRISYQYSLFMNKTLNGKIGFTGKIRDASIKISDGYKIAEKSNTGFVPLIYFSIEWKMSSRTGFFVEGDALAAPQGRAEDVLFSIYNNITDKVRLRAGYRLLEGGADNDEVYTFALVNYYSLGLTISIF